MVQKDSSYGNLSLNDIGVLEIKDNIPSCFWRAQRRLQNFLVQRTLPSVSGMTSSPGAWEPCVQKRPVWFAVRLSILVILPVLLQHSLPPSRNLLFMSLSHSRVTKQ